MICTEIDSYSVEGDIADRPAHSRSSSFDILNRFRTSANQSGSSSPNRRSRPGTPNITGTGSRPGSIFHGLATGASTPRVEWEGFEFDPAKARKEELRFAEGDVGKSKVGVNLNLNQGLSRRNGAMCRSLIFL